MSSRKQKILIQRFFSCQQHLEIPAPAIY